MKELMNLDLSNMAEHSDTGGKKTEFNSIGAAGAMCISRLTKLESLNLCKSACYSDRSAVGDCGAQYLAKL